MAEPKPLLVVYDGHCPFCAGYVRMLRLRAAAGPVEFVDARSGHPVVVEILAQGYDLDEGMALVRDADSKTPRIAHGDACFHELALMTTPVGVFNRLNAAIFRSERACRLLYPWLRRGRNLVLGMLGRRRLGDTSRASMF